MELETPSSQWFITTFNAPMAFNRGKDETWYFNPVRRYVLNSSHINKIKPYVDTISDIRGSSQYRPLMAGHPIVGRRIFVERFRDRGIGDLLFLTGPFAFMNHITGGEVKINVYAFVDRGAVLQFNPFIEHGTVYIGPTHYDDFQHYHYQWLVDSVTESNEESDQLNVYDALYRQIGVRPETVDPRFKRPYVTIDPGELDDLHQFWHTVWMERQFDLRQGYYVVAPLTHSPMRNLPYQSWLDIIPELAKRRPVILIGNPKVPAPTVDMVPGEFIQKAAALGPQVISLLDKQLALRSVMALISKATAFVGLDSGPLYVAQGLRVPSISLWGPHDPGVRIGYDLDYMDLAVWNQEFCMHSPCFAFGNFPFNKCPHKAQTIACECLRGIGVDDVLNKLEKIESRKVRSLGVFRAKNEKTTAVAKDTANRP